MSEGEILILQKNSAKICFDEKMVNKAGEWFLLTTKLYQSANDVVQLVPKKQNTEGAAVKKQDNTTTKQIVTRRLAIPEKTGCEWLQIIYNIELRGGYRFLMNVLQQKQAEIAT